MNLASHAGLIIQAYEDRAEAIGEMLATGASRFLGATLCPKITLQDGSDLNVADQFHEKVHDFCFIEWSF